MPATGVTARGETCTASWKDITPPSSLLRTHASNPPGSPFLRHLASCEESWQVATGPCCQRVLPDVMKIFPEMLDPVPRRSHRLHLPVSSSVSAAFPTKRLGRLPATFREYDFSRGDFRGCRYSLMFRPPSLLALQIVPTAAHTATGQPELLHPGITCIVTSARTGHANRLNTGN